MGLLLILSDDLWKGVSGMYSIKLVSDMLSTVMNDSTRKPLHVMLVEIISLWFRDAALPFHYHNGLMYKRDFDDDIYAYVGWQNIRRVYDRINNALWTPILDNKVLFDLYFRQTDIRLPRLVGFNIGNQFVVGDEVMWVSDGQQLRAVLELLVNSSPTASIFAKPTGGMQGKGCFAFDLSDIARIYANEGLELLKGHYVYQEIIAQHPTMAELHPSSVNTLRIDTYRTDQGEVDIMSALTRIGASKSCVDNASSGGCFVGVNLEQGTLMPKGFMLPKQNPAILECHPDTEMVFDGFEIPFFREAIMITRRAAEMIPVSVVGWDVAISHDGPMLVEGNADHDVRMSEMAYGGYWRNPVFRRLIEEHAPEMRRIGRHFDETDLG